MRKARGEIVDYKRATAFWKTESKENRVRVRLLHGDEDDKNILVPRTKVALVIGNGNYKRAKIMDTHDDADGMAEKLDQLGFDVTVWLDVGDSMDALMTDWRACNVQSGTLAVIYFAGHGCAHAGLVSHMIPVTGTSDDHVSVWDLVHGMSLNRDLKNAAVVFITDMCRSNLDGVATRTPPSFKVRTDAGRSAVGLFACQRGHKAYGGDGGVFTTRLIDAIGDGKTEIVEVFTKVFKAMPEYQQAWCFCGQAHKIYLGIPTGVSRSCVIRSRYFIIDSNGTEYDYDTELNLCENAIRLLTAYEDYYDYHYGHLALEDGVKHLTIGHS